VFRMILTLNADCFPKEHYPIGLYNGEETYLFSANSNALKGQVNFQKCYPKYH
jgi:hypothetical protein